MRTLSDYDYELPENKIALYPSEPRDISKMILFSRKTEKIIGDYLFKDIKNFLKKGDLLVVNNSKVIPARIFGKKEKSGGKVEVFILKFDEEFVTAFVKPSKRVKVGSNIILNGGALFKVEEKLLDGKFILKHNLSHSLLSYFDENAIMPLPPYIAKRRENNQKDFQDYQTIYANPLGSVACPTAGLHFTNELIDDIKNIGVEFAEVTLHVGAGTFKPVTAEKIEDHIMHEEFFEIDAKNSHMIEEKRKSNNRVIAVGTTVVRTLEHVCLEKGKITDGNGITDIFIKDGFNFKCIDGLITNFHLPRSTLLMLVSAFAGYENIMKMYHHALENGYRFYSYGDSMFIM